jgi:hypothetical protein
MCVDRPRGSRRPSRTAFAIEMGGNRGGWHRCVTSDVYEYLRDVIEHLNRGTAKPSALLPDVWKQSHPDAVRTYRQIERRDKAELARLRTAQRIVTS